jgi:hypothetical protein
MEWFNIASVEEMRGRVSLKTAADPADFERASYIHALHTVECLDIGGRRLIDYSGAALLFNFEDSSNWRC